MNRVASTDERLDDVANRMDAGFARVDADIRECEPRSVASVSHCSASAEGSMIGLVGVIAAVLVSPVGG